MKKLFSILALMLAFIGVSQANAQTDRPVTVKVNEQQPIDGGKVKIKFVALVGDSRCPADVRCVWAGSAKLKIELNRRNESKVFEINTNLKPQIVTFAGYEIKVIRLEPRIRSNVRINPNSYTATFSVVKKTNSK